MTTKAETKMTFATVVQARLGAELDAMGFSQPAAADEVPDLVTQVIFCASFDEIASRFPGMPAPDGYRVGTGLCFDIVVEGSLREGIVDVRAEGCSVDGAVIGSGDLETDLAALRSALVRAFADAARA